VTVFAYLKTQDGVGATGDPAAIIFPVRLLSKYTRERILANTMRKQLNDCLDSCDSHLKCPKATVSHLPTRVIDVGTNSQNPTVYTSHLNETNDLYAALSYCWDGPQNYITTRANLKQRTIGIPLQELPRTFQDGIIITRHLNIKFRWIDALCIIQDCEKDKILEVNKMDEVYVGAALTIAAANSDNVNGGFLKEYLRPVSCRYLSSYQIEEGGISNAYGIEM